MADCLIGIGANVGKREQSIARAVQEFRDNPEISSVVVSGNHRTEPVGGPAGQEYFLNAAARFQTSLSPEQLLRFLHGVERKLGRKRGERWGPRNIDLDLLLMDGLVLNTNDVVVPHPSMAFRRFVLESASEIAGDMVHPEMGWTIQELLDHLNRARPYVAFTGFIMTDKERIARHVARRLDCELITPFPQWPKLLPSDGIEVEMLKDAAAAAARRSSADANESIAKLLAPERFDAQQLCVSDFWFDEMVTLDRFFLSDEDFVHRKQQWLAWHENVMQPKLLVLLRTYPDSPDRERILERDDAFVQLARETARCPILCLDSGDSNLVIQEVTAAIAAMK